MKADFNIQAEQYIRQGKKRKNRGRIVAALSAVVALTTTYVLMLPGITMERDAQCGIEAHQHEASCYTANLLCTEQEREASEQQLLSMACGFTPHQHTDDCYRNGEIACGKTEEYFHQHDQMCRDGEGNLICTLKENVKHKHTGSCYEDINILTCESEESAGHIHQESCYTKTIAQETTCGMEENAGHVHSDDCYTLSLTCGTEEQAGHIHDDSCKTIETILICTEAEAEAHAHGESCYTTSQVLGCGLAEGEGAHTHNDSCYETVQKQICGQSAGDGAHTHGASCYTTTTKLSCTAQEHTHSDACKDAEGNLTCTAAEHAHGDACYTSETNLTCTTAESAGHVHNDGCYTTERNLKCTVNENAGHVHGDACWISQHTMTCTLNETSGHAHDDACYTTNEAIVCGMNEGDGAHAHTDTCYTTVLACGLEEGAGAHAHDENCYAVTEELTCGVEEGAGAHAHGEACYTLQRQEICDHPELHEHEASCYETDENDKRWCICELVELQEHQHDADCIVTITVPVEGHTHGETCYEQLLICTVEEHVHTDECYPDTTEAPTEAPTVEPTAEPQPTETATAVPETSEEPTVVQTNDRKADDEAENTVAPTGETVEANEVEAKPTDIPDAGAATDTDLPADENVNGEEVPVPTAEPTASPTEVPQPTAKPTEIPVSAVTTATDISTSTDMVVDADANNKSGENQSPVVTDEVGDNHKDTAPVATGSDLQPDESADTKNALPPATETDLESDNDAPVDSDTTDLPVTEPVSTDTDLPAEEAVTTETDLSTFVPVTTPTDMGDAQKETDDETFYCGLTDHEHTYDCLFACGKVEHIHGNGMAVFALFAVSDEEHTHGESCFDENGVLVCQLEEHIHTDACLMVADDTATDNSDPSSFAQYLTGAPNVSNKSTTTYEPSLNGYKTNLNFNFSMNNSVLVGANPTTLFSYNLPASVRVPDNYLNGLKIPLTINGSSDSGGYFYFVQENDRYVLKVDLSEYVKTLSGTDGTTTGNLNFDCIFDESSVDSDGNLDVIFDNNNQVEIPEDRIIYPADETLNYQLNTEKSDGDYNAQSNTLTYTVYVSSTKGTPGSISFVDNLNINNASVTGFTTEVKPYTTDAAGNKSFQSSVNVEPTTNGSTLSMTLPQIGKPEEGTTAGYAVTYTVQLADFGVKNVQTNGKNEVTVTSNNVDNGDVVTDSDEGTANINYNVLAKTGAYDAATDKITWTITVNTSGGNIAGQTLTDAMFASALDGINISPSEGAEIVVDSETGKTSVKFNALQDDKNKNSYTITYSTVPAMEDYNATQATVNNTVSFENTDTSVGTGVYVDRSSQYQVTKAYTKATLSDDGNTVAVDWKTTIKIDADGLSNDVTVTDNMQRNNEQYMTYAQVKALFDSLSAKGWVTSGSFKVKYITDESNPYNVQIRNEWVDFSTLSENDYANKKFVTYQFNLNSTELSKQEYWNKSIDLTYQSTVDVSTKNNDERYNNQINVGNVSASDQYVYEYTKMKPVLKRCSEHWNDEECAHQGSGNIKWVVNVYQNEDSETITVKDKLPANVALKNVMLLDTWSNFTLTYSGDGKETEAVDLVVNEQVASEKNVQVKKATYNPATGEIEVTLSHADGKRADALKEGQTLQIYYETEYAGERPAPGVTAAPVALKNNVEVYVNNETEIYGKDSQTVNLTLSTPVLLTKKDINNRNDSDNQTESQKYDSKSFGWCLNAYQDKEYDQIVLTDTLPEGVSLVRIQTGVNHREMRLSLDTDQTTGVVTLTESSSYDTENQKKLDISAQYDIDNRIVTITVKKGEGWTTPCDIFGAGKTFVADLYCEINSDQLPDEAGETVDLTYKNTADVKMTKGEEAPVTQKADHTQKLTLSYIPRVVKTDGSNNQNTTIVNNADGKLKWKVVVYQDAEYDYLVIEDQLPKGIVELYNEQCNAYGCIDLGNNYWLRIPQNAQIDDDGNIKLEVYNPYTDSNYHEITCDATFNPSTGKIRIKIEEAEGRNSNSLGANAYLTLQYYCKITDAYMPNVEDGEFVKELGVLTNSVSVTAEDIPYGSDTHGQDVTITQERGDVETVTKGRNPWNGVNDSYQLSYYVDINADALELDPSKNTLTVVDTVSYYRTDADQRDLTLVQDSVQLYYADYDANGTPIVDENNRLVKGKMVDYSDWTMTYQDDVQNNGQYNCIMTLTVPDNRAMILEYKYQVSMVQDAEKQPELNVTNTVKINGFDNDASTNQTDSNETWTWVNASGSVGSGHVYKLIKHDAANQAHGLAGVQFTVYQYNKTNSTWEQFKTIDTDENGVINIQMTETDKYSTDVAYRIVETATINGYELPQDAPEYYFYWSAGSAVPEGIPEGANAVNLDDSNQTTLYPVKIPNTKKSTQLEVEKVWLTANGDPLPGRDTPSSVSVQLRRYAIPDEDKNDANRTVWEQMVFDTDNKINGALVDSDDQTQVTITVMSKAGSNAKNNFTTTVNAYVGATLEFDLKMKSQHGIGNSGEWNFYPELNGARFVSSRVENGSIYYHYAYVVKKNMKLTGYMRNNYDWNNIWNDDNLVSSDPSANIVTIDNIVASNKVPADQSQFTSMLAPYLDRSYEPTAMKLTAAGNWQGSWENLDVEGTVDGKKVHYKYFIKENSVSGFATNVTGYSSDNGGSFVVENRQDNSYTETTSLRVVKEWYDANGNKTTTPLNGEDGKPLDQVEIRLYQMDSVTGEESIYRSGIIINDATGWGFNFTNLPKKTVSASGVTLYDYTYRVEEVTKGQFSTELVTQEGPITVTDTDETVIGTFDKMITVKNSAQQMASISVSKAWADNLHIADSVTVELSRELLTEDGFVADESFTKEQIVLNSNSWSTSWSGLDTGVQDQKSYRYVVKEVKVGDVEINQSGYIVTYDGNGDGSVPNNGSMVITNTPKTQIEVEKVWNGDGEGAEHDPVVVTLYKKSTNLPETVVETVEIGKADADGNANWNHIWSALPAGEVVNGTYEQLTYYVKEKAVEGYTTTYKVGDGETTANSSAPATSGKITITNTREQAENIDISVTKEWKTADGEDLTTNLPESISFKLYRKTAEGNAEVVQVEGMESGYLLTASAQWSMTIEGMPSEDESGNAYTYYIVETAVDGFVTSYDRPTDITVNDANVVAGAVNNGAATITNTATKLEVEKQWLMANGTDAWTTHSATTVYLQLLKDDQALTADELSAAVTDSSLVDGAYLKLAGNSKATLVGLAEGTYTVKEVAYQLADSEKVPIENNNVREWTINDTASFALNINQAGLLTVTNTQNASLSISKVWKKQDGQTWTDHGYTVYLQVTNSKNEVIDPALYGATHIYTDSQSQNTWLVVSGTEPVVLNGLSVDIYTVEEVAYQHSSDAAPTKIEDTTPMSWTIDVTSAPDQSNSAQTNYTVTNTATKLTIEKEWKNSAGEAWTDHGYTVYLALQKVVDGTATIIDPTAYGANVTEIGTGEQTIKAIATDGSAAIVINGLPTGEYTVTEVAYQQKDTNELVLITCAEDEVLPWQSTVSGGNLTAAQAEAITVTNMEKENGISLTVNKVWIGDPMGNNSVTVNVYQSYRAQNSPDDAEWNEELFGTYAITRGENGAWSTVIANLPTTGEKTIDNVTTEVDYRYRIEEANLDGYSTVYSEGYDSLTETGTVEITNFQNKTGNLTVKKEWVKADASEVQFKLYRFATPKATPAVVNWVPVDFRIEPCFQNEVFSTTKMFFPENAVVIWKPVWINRGDWHPSDANNNVDQSGAVHTDKNQVTYNGQGNYFAEATRSTDRYVYSFNLGSIGSGGTAVWKTDWSGYRDTKETDGTVYNVQYWMNDFAIAGEGEKELYSEETYTIPAYGQYNFNNLVFEDAEYTYRYVVEEVTTGYTTSYGSSSNGQYQRDVTISNYKPQTIKLKIKKQWYDADNTELETPPQYIKFNLIASSSETNSWQIGETIELRAGEDGTWEYIVPDVLYEGHPYHVVEVDVCNGTGQSLLNSFTVEYSTDGTNWTNTASGAKVTPNATTDSTLYIRNTRIPSYVLPETGGEGTQWYTGAGAMLIGIALTLLYKGNKRKRRAEEQ